jgi:hypothetical protein
MSHYEQVYYEIYQSLTRYTAYEVVSRLRHSGCAELQNFHTPVGLDPKIEVSMGSMNSDHSLMATFETTQVKSHAIYFQLVLLHQDFYGQRKLRVINSVLPIAHNVDAFYKNLNCEALIFYSLRIAGDQIRSLERDLIRTKITTVVSEVIREYRKFVIKTYSGSQTKV